MLKKVLLVLIFAALAANGAFSQIKMSAGVGISTTGAFGGGYETTNSSISEGYKIACSGGTAFGYFDIKYVEVSIGYYFYGTFDMEERGELKFVTPSYIVDGITLGLLGKFPLQIGSKFAVFPAVGIDYYLILSARDSYYNYYSNASDLSHLWIKVGAGFDFLFNNLIFLRATALYGIRFNSKFEDDLIAYERSDPDASVNPKLDYGIQIKLAIGFNF